MDVILLDFVVEHGGSEAACWFSSRGKLGRRDLTLDCGDSLGRRNPHLGRPII